MSTEELQQYEDRNGYWEKGDVLLSKVGVFPYLGAQIAGAPDPTKIYRVYRPVEELKAAVESFRLVPWVDEHEMLGPEEEGCTPAEEKGVHGVTGEQVYFEEGGKSEDNAHGGIRGNIKLFSESMKKLIEDGKEALSLGYRSRYDWTPGTWNGEAYDVVQRHIRGNHLALCDAGRMGPEVTVFDHLDIKEFVKMEDDKKTAGEDTQDSEVTLEQVAVAIKELSDRIGKLEASGKSEVGDDDGAAKDDEGAAEDDDGAAQDNEGGTKDDEGAVKDGDGKDDDGAAGEDGKKEGTGMDAALKRLEKRMAKVERGQGIKTVLAQAAERDRLAGRITPLVGTFDHAHMTPDDVAVYGCKKLGISCAKGQERAALSGYLAAAARHTPSTFTFDAAASPKPGKALDDYLKGGN